MSPSFHTDLSHLFRHEYGKLVAVLTKIFGTHKLALVEDVVQDTLLKALETWKLKGLPDNPSAWLFTVARNKALDVIRKEKHHREFANQLAPLLKSEYTASLTLYETLHTAHIEDEQLRMMFVCCHPSIAEETQIALILKTLCGFSIAEIASAFLTNEETISKRLVRGREKFREVNIPFELPPKKELTNRLDNVLTAIYLLFNEGYHATHSGSIIRDDLVEEALRLANLLRTNNQTNTPATNALLALMCFHAARLYNRLTPAGVLLQLKDQDRSTWNQSLIQQGVFFLKTASTGEHVSSYHVEAAIAYEHCIAASYSETNWKRIDSLYETLTKLKPEPLVAFQRVIIKANIKGPLEGLTLLKAFEEHGQLINHNLLYAAKGEWLSELGRIDGAIQSFQTALKLTRSPAEQKLIQSKIDELS